MRTLMLSLCVVMLASGCASKIRTKPIGAGLCKTMWNDEVRFAHPTGYEEFKCECSEIKDMPLLEPETNWKGEVTKTTYLSCPKPSAYQVLAKDGGKFKQTEELPAFQAASPMQAVMPDIIRSLGFVAGMGTHAAVFPATRIGGQSNQTDIRASTVNPR